MKKIILGFFVLSILVVGGKAFAVEVIVPVTTVTVTSPNSIGKVFEAGDEIDIKWSSNAPDSSFFDVYVSNGTIKGPILKTTKAGVHELEYVLDATLVPGTNYKAFVSLVSTTETVSDSSDNPFEIKAESINDDEDDDNDDDSDDENDDSDDDSDNEDESDDDNDYGQKEQERNRNGCLFGYKFNPKTGEACPVETIINNGCMKGYKFNPITGNACPIVIDDKKEDKKIDEKKDCTAAGSNCGVRNYGISRILKKGVRGDDVKVLQSLLNLIEDGVFGPETKARLVEWQAKNGLTPDGIFGPQSRQKAEIED